MVGKDRPWWIWVVGAGVSVLDAGAAAAAAAAAGWLRRHWEYSTEVALTLDIAIEDTVIRGGRLCPSLSASWGCTRGLRSVTKAVVTTPVRLCTGIQFFPGGILVTNHSISCELFCLRKSAHCSPRIQRGYSAWRFVQTNALVGRSYQWWSSGSPNP
ncbi:hypothetical protein LXA43DRAFT_56459 [Ganoderma leucocontextum]|nr:hypothetical protein LXA43DRAFT_56459 [Ganoderma leucocontextum]